jgi:hypothetical protein
MVQGRYSILFMSILADELAEHICIVTVLYCCWYSIVCAQIQPKNRHPKVGDTAFWGRSLPRVVGYPETDACRQRRMILVCSMSKTSMELAAMIGF